MMAGSDFIKTSTGKEGVNATLAVGLVMCRAIREYQDVTGFRVGFKPAGGIRSVEERDPNRIMVQIILSSVVTFTPKEVFIPEGSSVIINFQNCQGCDELVNLDQGGARGLLA